MDAFNHNNEHNNNLALTRNDSDVQYLMYQPERLKQIKKLTQRRLFISSLPQKTRFWNTLHWFSTKAKF